MARPRRGKPATAFGAWLEQWLGDHPDVTFEALGDQIGVTKSAISLWLTATHQAKIPIPRLRRIAAATGVSADYLEQLVYGAQADRHVDPPPPEWAELMRGQLDGIRRLLERSPDATQRAIADGIVAYQGRPDAATVDRRRSYWIRRARERLAPKGKKVMSFAEVAERMELTGNAATLPSRWERGASVDPAYFDRLARALHIPLSDIEVPPETDEERLDRWAREFTAVDSDSDRRAARRRAS